MTCTPIHLDTHDYALAKNDIQASRALRKRQPTGIILTRRVGPDEADALAYKMASMAAMPKSSFPNRFLSPRWRDANRPTSGAARLC